MKGGWLGCSAGKLEHLLTGVGADDAVATLTQRPSLMPRPAPGVEDTTLTRRSKQVDEHRDLAL
jgi:hypothetical protein